jgi:intracellular multiplication protein IcmK
MIQKVLRLSNLLRLFLEQVNKREGKMRVSVVRAYCLRFFLCFGLCFFTSAFAEKSHNIMSDTQIEKNFGKSTSVRKKAFAKIPGSLMPMSPNQIRLVHRLLNRTKSAEAGVGGVPPKPTSSSLVVDLSPGGEPPVIRLTAGFITSVVFVDATGAPWPIQAYDIGNPRAFNIQWIQSTKADLKRGTDLGNTLLVQAINGYKAANLAVMLQGLNTPVMVTLIPGQKSVDYRVDVHIPRDGPNAFPQVMDIPGSVSTELMNVLNNVVPKGAKVLNAGRKDVRAWVIGSAMYLRTNLTLISPSWQSVVSSPDGAIRAYKMEPSSVVLALDRGNLTELTFEGF